VGQYSILGFSEGGRVGLVMGATYPNEILKIVTIGASCYVTDEERNPLRPHRQITNWGPSLVDEMRVIYGDELEPLWDQFVETYFKYTDIFKTDLAAITCPVFILHGEQDQIVPVEHGRYLKAHLKNGTLYTSSKGPHNFHITDHALVNYMAQTFLLEY